MITFLVVTVLLLPDETQAAPVPRTVKVRKEEPLQSTEGFSHGWRSQIRLLKQPVILPDSQDRGAAPPPPFLGVAAPGSGSGALPATVSPRVSGTTSLFSSDALVTRAFDIVLALLLLIATLPIIAVALSAVRLTSTGPLIFRQYRVGRFGRPFVCFKIRTMVEDADVLLDRDHSLHGSYAERWKLADDPRILPVGRWLRRASIDELPQLVNVLRGEMSIVGPRPVQLKELHERYGDLAEIVFSINPGLTGLWQVSGRSSVDYARRIALDLEYVHRRSLWFDVLLVFKTIPAVCSSRGAC